MPWYAWRQLFQTEYLWENLEAAAKLLKGEEEVIESELDAILITADNVDEYLDYYVEKGALTQEEVDAVRAEVGE